LTTERTSSLWLPILARAAIVLGAFGFSIGVALISFAGSDRQIQPDQTHTQPTYVRHRTWYITPTAERVNEFIGPIVVVSFLLLGIGGMTLNALSEAERDEERKRSQSPRPTSG
jgi:hypothetical protein